MAYKYKTTYEMCPHCEQEVRIKNVFGLQTCPKCKTVIMPCSICDATNEDVKEPKCSCDKCPLVTKEYRDRLIADAFNNCYKTDSDDNYGSNMAYLETLTNMELSIKISEAILDNDRYISYGSDDND